MISLDRRKNHKWIFQKNISSTELMNAYVQALNDINNEISYYDVKNTLKNKRLYRGRSQSGNVNTMSVRFSQMCFYMFGYKLGNKFVPSPMTTNLLQMSNKISKESNALVNLFSMQFPQPYSNTSPDFNIYVGRLIVKLLLDERIEQKLYVDEIIWFLPFIEEVNLDIYEELIESINEYRRLTYDQKYELFKSVRDYNDVFSNVLHEMNYYFIRIFEAFGVFEAKEDISHNGGKLFTFIHGSSTKRVDSYKSRKNTPGYILLSEKVKKDAGKLDSKFSAFDKPLTQQSEGIYSLKDWLVELYEIEPLNYLNEIAPAFLEDKNIINIITKMVHCSKYGSSDGKEFEKSLKPAIELFRETENVEIISGSGKTDLLCAMRYSDDSVLKMNVDAKTRIASLQEINARRINSHLERHGAKYCMIVAPKFSSGVEQDIQGNKIVVLKAETLGAYLFKECSNSRDGFADFDIISKIIENAYGTDITESIQDLIYERYGTIV